MSDEDKIHQPTGQNAGRFQHLILDVDKRRYIEKYMTYRNWYRRWNQIQRFSLILNVFETHLPGSGKLLDAGCGPGMYAIALGHQYETYAVDLADRYLERLRKWKDEVGKPIYISKQSITKLAYKDNVFNAVLCTEVIEHLDCPAHGVRELYRVLSPGGKLVFSMPNLFSLFWFGRKLILQFSGAKDEETSKHLKYHYTKIRNMLTSNGFKVQQVYGVNYFEIPNERFINALCKHKKILILLNHLENVLNRTPLRRFAANLVFLCEKPYASS